MDPAISIGQLIGVPHIVQTTAVPRKNGGNSTREKYVFKSTCCSAAAADAEENLWTTFRSLVEEMNRVGKSKVAIPRIEGFDIHIQVKMLECLTGRTRARVDLYTPIQTIKGSSTPAGPTPSGITGTQWQFPRFKNLRLGQ